jgi:hypothetical protein
VDPRDLALAQARGRIAVGVAMLLAPGLAARAWIGEEAASPAVKVLARAFGARDLALGLGVAIALDRGAPVRGWLEAGALADTADFTATLLAGGSIPPGARAGVMAVAAGSGAAAIALSRTLDQPSEPVSAPEAALTGHPVN